MVTGLLAAIMGAVAVVSARSRDLHLHDGAFEAPVARIDGLEAEHQSLLSPCIAAATATATGTWTPPVLDAHSHLFSWRVQLSHTGVLGNGGKVTAVHVAEARNVTQVSATLTLTTASQPPIVCRPTADSDLSLVCGDAKSWSSHPARYTVTLDVVLRSGGGTARASVQGWFIRGLQQSPAGWGGAEWIGLSNANDTAAQYRSVSLAQTAPVPTVHR